MKEESQSAYYNLINALLTCTSSKEVEEIFQAYPELLDVAWVTTMQQISQIEAQQGKQSTASWLHNAAQRLATAQLATAITRLSVDKLSAETFPEALYYEIERLYDQGLQQYQSGQIRAGVQSWHRALRIYQAIGNTEGEVIVLGNIGDAYLYLGEFQYAIDYLQRQQVIAQQIGRRRLESASLISLSNVYHCLGQYPQAIEYSQQSLSISGELGFHRGQAAALSSLGNVYCSLGQYQKAISCYRQTLVLAREIGDHRYEAIALNNLGNTYHAIGQYQQAIDFYQQSLAVCREMGYRSEEADCLGNLGLVYTNLGQYQWAIGFLQQQLAIVQEIEDRPKEANSLNNLGEAYRNLAQYQKAIDFYQQSLEICREIGERSGEAASLGNLGIVYKNLGQYQQAIEFHQQQLSIAREIGTRDLEANSLGSLGIVCDLRGQYQQAIELYHQQLEITREILYRSGEGISLSNLGIALFHNNQMTESEETLSNGIEVWESIRFDLKDADKISIFETQASAYRYLQRVLFAQNKTDKALEIAERGRTRAFVELLANALSTKPVEVTDELSPKEAIDPPTIEQIQHIAQEQKATIIEYSIINLDHLFIWVIKPTGEITFRPVHLQPLRQEQNISLSDLVSQARESLGVEETLRGTTSTITQETPQLIRYINEPLRQLHQYLVEPIANLLPTDPNAHVIFIPQGSLFLVPFPALQDATGKFLIEQHTILTAPSIQVLELTRKQRQRVETIHELPLQSHNALVVGNPKMPTIPLREPLEPLPPLPGAEAEAIAIASLLNTQAIIGDKATKLEIVQQMPKARLIHLATHGLLDDIKQLGVPGAIALAPSDHDNGFLTAGEILEMKLNAELIVLSACSSGQGKITGDGVIGLSRSLFAAGVPSVIVSLWSVGDDSTEFLMTEFYQNLQSGMNKAQALRQAILKTREDFSDDPYSWAAFTLIGEAE